MNVYRQRTALGIFEFAYRPDNGKLRSIEWAIPETAAVDNVVELNVNAIQKPCLPRYLENLIEGFEGWFRGGAPFCFDDWSCLDFSAVTPFQQKVYIEAGHIPLGETRTYSWIAERLQNQGATRAVGQALRRNPFIFLVPCHRVVGVSSGLTGFMGKRGDCPELRLKSQLISLEHRFRNPVFSFLSEG